VLNDDGLVINEMIQCAVLPCTSLAPVAVRTLCVRHDTRLLSDSCAIDAQVCLGWRNST
jgi:hypothetical protein